MVGGKGRIPKLKLQRGDGTSAIQMDVTNVKNMRAYFEELQTISTFTSTLIHL